MRWGGSLARLLILVLALSPSSAHAAELRSGDTVTIAPGQVVNDDLYIAGGTVQIDGRVNGDVVVAGGTVAINGEVSGNVIAVGGTIAIAGPVGGSVRAAGGSMTVNGPVADDVLFGGGQLTLGTGARIGRDLWLGSGLASVPAPVGRNLVASAGELTIGGPVGGDVRAEVATLRLTSGAHIAGNLWYASEREAEIAPGATVRGRVERQVRAPRAESPHAEQVVGRLVGWLSALVGVFALGLLLVFVFPLFSRRASDIVVGSPWVSLGLGIVLLVSVPLAALVLFVAGLVVGGWWLGLLALALYGSALACGYVLVGLAVGRWVLARVGRSGMHLVWALLLGLLVLLLLGELPYIGWVITALALLFGLGALSFALVRAEPQSPAPSPAA